MYPHYGLVLNVTHDCNMRCTYCYAGTKRRRTMPQAYARRAIDRAIASIEPGGTLDLGFFGGEPLLEAELIEKLIAYARSQVAAAGIKLALTMTTNGTVDNPRAWSIMTMPEMSLSISCDGLPDVHDRHRSFTGGAGSAVKVLSTMRRLREVKKPFHVVMVVRPDTVDDLPTGIEFLRALGVRRIEPSLDVWTDWSEADIARLEKVVARCAQIWREGLPFVSIGWFDEKAVHLARLPRKPVPRCGFGRGEITVAPSGRLYPCERLVGDDTEDSPMALPGHVLDGDDFLNVDVPSEHPEHACHECTMLNMCSTFCRCSNYIRTGNTRRPDLLLCAWNQACLNETAKIIHESLLTVGPTEKGEQTCDRNEHANKIEEPQAQRPDPCAAMPC